MTLSGPGTPPTVAVAEALADFDHLLTRLANPAAATPATRPGNDVTTVAPTLGFPTKAPGDIFRPNGEKYVPRKVTVNGDVVDDVMFVKQAYNNGLPVLLYGPPGTGKTAMLEAALPGLVTLQGTVETEVADFVGSWVQKPDGTYAWVDGPLTFALDNGLPLLVDEIALIDPRVMAVAYGVSDGRGELVVTANPDRGVVKAQPGFLLFGAFNPNVPGALLSDAMLSRFMIHVEVNTDWSLAKKLGVPAQLIQVARNLNLKQRSGQVTAAPQLRELLTYNKVAAAFGDSTALSNFVGQTHEEDRQTVIEQVEAVFGTKPASLTM